MAMFTNETEEVVINNYFGKPKFKDSSKTYLKIQKQKYKYRIIVLVIFSAVQITIIAIQLFALRTKSSVEQSISRK